MIVVLSARDAWLAAALRLQHIEPLLRERAQPRLTCGALRRVNDFAPSTHTTLAPRAGVPCAIVSTTAGSGPLLRKVWRSFL